MISMQRRSVGLYWVQFFGTDWNMISKSGNRRTTKTVPPASAGLNGTDLTGVGGSKPQTATSSLYHQLRRDIVHGRLAPGERLRIEILRDRYEIGSSPIREALSRLSSEDLVILQEQKGFRVAEVSIYDLLELTRSRCLLNEIVVRESITNGDDAWEEAIVLAFHRMSRIARADQPDGQLWDHQHRIFHDAIVAACGSKWLRNLSLVLFDGAERYRKLSQAAHVPRDAEQEHFAIMQATTRRDIPTAIHLLNEHAIVTAKIITDVWGDKTDGAGRVIARN
jgi:GntR family carbon starvation induced transcriptional regulator